MNDNDRPGEPIIGAAIRSTHHHTTQDDSSKENTMSDLANTTANNTDRLVAALNACQGDRARFGALAEFLKDVDPKASVAVSRMISLMSMYSPLDAEQVVGLVRDAKRTADGAEHKTVGTHSADAYVLVGLTEEQCRAIVEDEEGLPLDVIEEIKERMVKSYTVSMTVNIVLRVTREIHEAYSVDDAINQAQDDLPDYNNFEVDGDGDYEVVEYDVDEVTVEDAEEV